VVWAGECHADDPRRANGNGNANLPKRIGQARAREVAIRFTNNKSYIYGMVDKPAGMLLSGLWKVRGCLAKKAPYPGLANTLLTG
jgi:hypothetical protein